MKKKLQDIDFKSFIIGFLLAAVVFLSVAAAAGSGTQDVRIVDIDTYDTLRVKLDEVGSVTVPVKIEGINYSLELPVKIEGIDSSVKLPVRIRE